MNFSIAYHWLTQGTKRQDVLINLAQPMTAKQLCKHLEMSEKSCGERFSELGSKGLVLCLNPKATRSRLYWLSEMGRQCREKLLAEKSLDCGELQFPFVNWELYGWVCYSHRATIIKTLTIPMQPSAIKRKARFNDPTLRMSAANVRDVIKLFLRRGIVRPVIVQKERYPKYELTKLGNKLRELLINAERGF